MLEPAGFAEPPYRPGEGSTEDDFEPAPKVCPHCRLFYSQQEWQIEAQGAGWKAELILWCKCSNCGGYIERRERHR